MDGGGPGVEDAAAGGDASAIDPQRSTTEACLAYGIARLYRKRECAGEVAVDELQAAFSLDCPDLYFSEGSTATVEDLALCAETWKTFPCESVTLGLEPACAPRGTKQGGEPCISGAQCRSGACPHTYQHCGACIASAAPGEPCDGAKLCDAGYRCDGVCVPVDPDYVAGSVAVGAPCIETVDCAGTARCLPNVGGDLVCVAPTPVGGFCDGIEAFCEADAYCNDENRCAYGGAGVPCSRAVGSAPAVPCAAGFECMAGEDGIYGICRALPGADEPCERGGRACPVGELCLTNLPCFYQCVGAALPGQACNQSVLCHPGSECRNGLCQAIPLQGLFEQWCADM